MGIRVHGNRMSVATIDSPEFVNVSPYNPLISQCEIKVLYVGQNRNKSFITKEVATEMANSLPGCPIVGYYKEDKGDFADHGDKVVIDDEGLHFECMTKPYGFVAPDAKVWFQKFVDTDEFGNEIEREYLMTTGYLWTGQYKEAQQIIEDGGKPHSMELDEDTLQGNWSKDIKSGMDFFIINDAIFSKLCVLGDDVEPCFEGSSVSAPNISSSFTKVDEDFKQTLFTMMDELKFALKGGKEMPEINEQEVVVDEVSTSVETEGDATITEGVEIEDAAATDVEVDFKKKEDEEDAVAEEDTSKEDDYKEEDEKKKDYVKEEDKKEEPQKEEEDKEENEKPETKSACKDDDDEKKKYQILQDKYTELEEKYAALEEKHNELVEFKASVEKKEKEELINSFYMLSEEDKKDVIENIDKYSKHEIEAELSILCVKHKVNFDLENTNKNDNKVEDVTTYTLTNSVETDVPEWVSAVRNLQNSNY